MDTPTATTGPDLASFRPEALSFLEAHAKRRSREERRFVWGEGSDSVSLFEEPDADADAASLVAAKEWRRACYDAGFRLDYRPDRVRRPGLSATHERTWHDLERQFVTPSPAPFNIGLGMVAPTILAHGNELTKGRYLQALYRADMIGCQLFSEPEAGSDLASVATRAECNGDEWIIDGQKVWTSGAHYSDIGLLLARSAPEPRSGNLTAFIVDMHAAGVGVRPLRQMTGGAAFNEPFHRRSHPRPPPPRRAGRRLAGSAHHAHERTGGRRA